MALHAPRCFGSDARVSIVSAEFFEMAGSGTISVRFGQSTPHADSLPFR